MGRQGRRRKNKSEIDKGGEKNQKEGQRDSIEKNGERESVTQERREDKQTEKEE